MNIKKNTRSTIAVMYLLLSIAITLFMTQTPFSITAHAYEGFGAVTRGALDAPGGYEIFHVTTLDDNGDHYNPIPGSFRDAVDQSGKDGRYVVFDVGGTISLRNDLAIQSSYITIDGSTAPYPGITIDQFTYDTVGDAIGTAIEPYLAIAHDIIIHHLRMIGPGSAGNGDLLALNGFHDNSAIYNVIIDHCTAIATGDGVFDTNGNVSNITVSWNLIMDNYLTNLVSYGSGDDYSYHHNVYARNAERQPMLDYDVGLMDFVNNVIYGWGGWGGTWILYKEGITNPNANIENNVYQLWADGPYDRPEDAIRFERGPDEGNVYFNGNIVPVGETDYLDPPLYPRLPIPAYAEVTMYPASTLGDTVVPFAGTHYPTQEEQDLLNEIRIAIGTSGNHAPIANAGPDQTVIDEDNDGEEPVTLDGSGSQDPDGTIVSYVWSEGGLQIGNGINPTVILSTGTHLITLTVTDDGGLTDTDTVTVKVLKGDKEFGKLPRGCYNNVFNPAKGEKALIVVELAEQAHVKLGLYNIRGNKIKELADEQKEAGTHKYYWDGKSSNGDVVGSGLYFVHIQAGDYKKTKKIVIIK